MQDFVPYEKLSKKQKKAVDRRARGTWGDVNPVTKKKESARIYNRKKHRLGREDSRAGVFFFAGLLMGS
ncbi:MAG: hypothetical protein Q4A66_12580 [Eubacteriales bacterium]|nr:hypothetical protein [Eubacteriales bacterium]